MSPSSPRLGCIRVWSSVPRAGRAGGGTSGLACEHHGSTSAQYTCYHPPSESYIGAQIVHYHHDCAESMREENLTVYINARGQSLVGQL